MPLLHKAYPWTKGPLIICAPMRAITTAPLVAAVTRAQGLAFLGAGTDLAPLPALIHRTTSLLPSSISTSPVLPFGIGLQLYPLSPAPVISFLSSLPLPPAAIWLFAPSSPADLGLWAAAVRAATDNRSKVWIQVGCVADALAAVRDARPDVLVVQGSDAGGHGLARGAGLVPLLPEVVRAVRGEVGGEETHFVAAGGIMDGITAGAAVVLGAEGVVLGTRMLATEEAEIREGYKRALLRAEDGGRSTVRSRLFDSLRGIEGWPAEYDGRGIVNRSWTDHESGMEEGENRRLYEEKAKEGDEGWERMVGYAGSGVGLVSKLKPAGEVVVEVREGMVEALKRAGETVRQLEE